MLGVYNNKDYNHEDIRDGHDKSQIWIWVFAPILFDLDLK